MELIKREERKRAAIMDWFCERYRLDFTGPEIMELRAHLKENGHDDLPW